MFDLDVTAQAVLCLSGQATLFTHIQLVPAFLVGILLDHTMNLFKVSLQGAALSEGLLTHIALKGPDTCKRN